MAIAYLYDHTIGNFLDQSFAPTDTYVVMLIDSDGVAAFDPTNTTLAQASNTGGYEVYGNGWAQGGKTIANTDIITYATSEKILDGDNVTQAITGGSLGPFSGYLIFDDTDADDAPVAMVVLDAPQTINENYLATIEWPVTGIIWFKQV